MEVASLQIEFMGPPLGAPQEARGAPGSRVVIASGMHRRGVGYQATLRLPDGSDTPLYTSPSWENVPVETFAPGKLLPAGSAVDYRCHHHNDEDRTVLQGFTTRDEMCMFVGVYYPRDSALERCALDDTWWTSDFAATHVGHGAVSCAATLDCFSNAPRDDKGDGFAQCIDASCPAAADALWAAERCRMFHAHGACDEACKSEPSAACTACLEAGCASELSTCRSSGC